METVVPEMTIRNYSLEDRNAVREISYQTAFLERVGDFFDDRELVKDALTIYFTDYEPESTFVACDGQTVVGYVMGTKDAQRMNSIFSRRILPGLLGKAVQRGVFFRGKGANFLFHIIGSFLKGEFFMPDFSRRYPALLHINIEKDYRGQHIGEKLLHRFIQYLQENHVQSLHVSTFSKQGQRFFLKQNFEIIFSRARSYLRYRLKEDIRVYILKKDV